MSTLTIHLKHLYQRRGLWLVYLFLGIYLFACTVSIKEEGGLAALVLLMFLAGLVAGVTALDVVVRPFSFCLPGHGPTMRKYLFVIAVAVNLAAAQAMWLYPGLEGLVRLGAVASMFFAGMMVFWAGVSVSFGIRNVGGVVGWFVFVFFVGQSLGVHVPVERFLIDQPLIVSAVGLFVIGWMWRWLGRRDLARRNCNKAWIGFLDAFNRDKVSKFRQARGEKLDKAMRKAAPWVERFFIARIAGGRGAARCAWACLYATFGPGLALWKRWVPFVAVLALTVGYLGSGAWFMLVFMPAIMLMGLRLPVYSTMLIAAGRRERFVATVVQAVVITVSISAAAVAVAALLIPLSRYVPPIPIKEGITLTLRPVDLRLSATPLIVMPAAMTLHVLLYRRLPMAFIAMMGLVYVVMFTAIVSRGELMRFVRIDVAMGAMAMCWGVYLLTLRHVSRRQCLVAG